MFKKEVNEIKTIGELDGRERYLLFSILEKTKNETPIKNKKLISSLETVKDAITEASRVEIKVD